jgi:hypothetical protein
VQKHVGRAAIGNDEAVPLGNVEPLNEARDLDKPYRCLFGKVFDTRFLLVYAELRSKPIRPHDAATSRSDASAMNADSHNSRIVAGSSGENP